MNIETASQKKLTLFFIALMAAFAVPIFILVAFE